MASLKLRSVGLFGPHQLTAQNEIPARLALRNMLFNDVWIAGAIQAGLRHLRRIQFLAKDISPARAPASRFIPGVIIRTDDRAIAFANVRHVDRDGTMLSGGIETLRPNLHRLGEEDARCQYAKIADSFLAPPSFLTLLAAAAQQLQAPPRHACHRLIKSEIKLKRAATSKMVYISPYFR